jgi:hypothetical protein
MGEGIIKIRQHFTATSHGPYFGNALTLVLYLTYNTGLRRVLLLGTVGNIVRKAWEHNKCTLEYYLWSSYEHVQVFLFVCSTKQPIVFKCI